MKFIQKIGLGLFVFALLLFTSLIFLEQYSVQQSTITSLISGEEVSSILTKNLSPIIDNKVSKTKFQSTFSEAIKNTNDELYAKHAFTEAEINKIVTLSSTSYSISDIGASDIFLENKSAKIKALTDHTSWLEGRELTDGELRNNLIAKATEINKGVLEGKSINKYATKSLNVALARESMVGIVGKHPLLLFFLTFGLATLGALVWIVPEYIGKPKGIKNNHIFQDPDTNKGWIAYLVFGWLVTFYCLLYFKPEWLTELTVLVDPVSKALSGNIAGEWFLYGFLYCMSMIVMGIRMYFKYAHNIYQIIRTSSVLFFQICFAFLIPEIMVRLNMPWYDLKNMWPLDYDFFFNDGLLSYESGGGAIFGTTAAKMMFIWGIVLFLVIMPILVYFFGKRWYCSWVCGCGGLAETLGDPYRQLSDKSLGAWKFERWMIHGVLVFAVLMTGLTLFTLFSGEWSIMGIQTDTIQSSYALLIGSIFSGVIGTGFYPMLGNRIWCRMGCPLAAYMGIIQKFKSRFRITTNGGQCISCGNCSTYCEQGIDVRAYAQKGQNIVRASCVGCGVCSAVCPRGVLKLENGPEENRVDFAPILIGNDVKLSELIKDKN